MKSHILVVDDIPQNLQLMGSLLRMNGYQVSVAASGEQALQLIEKVAPDLILLDVMMPKMSGYEVCGIVKKNENFAHIPIIFLSGKIETEDIIAGFDAGGADYVTKPFNQAELLARVRTHLEVKHSKDVIAKQYEALLASNNALAEANAAKDKFLSIIAHDIRSPFQGILGLTEMFKQPEMAADTAAVQEMSSAIFESATHIYALLDELLEYAKSSMGVMEYNPKDFLLKDVVESSVAIVSSTAQAKNIEVTIDNSVKNISVYADWHITSTIIRNLLSNAVKFTPAGGAVMLTARTIDKIVELDVADSGVGMTSDDIQKLFRTDVKHTTLGTNNEKGTGFGLLLCKNLAERQLGTIRVRSVVGEGSIFTISIPMVNEII